MWLNEIKLDIRYARMQPCISDRQIFIDVQTVIPILEAADYQVRIRGNGSSPRLRILRSYLPNRI